MRVTIRGVVLSAIALVAAAAGFGYWTTDSLATLGGNPSGARLERMRQSPTYDATGEVFVNAIETTTTDASDTLDILTEWLFGNQQRSPPGPVPIETPEADAFDQAPSTGLRITWLGHSTVLIEIDDMVVLTDPVFAERSSPSRHIGPRRFHPLPVAIDDLPPIDAVVISHDHYDHLDYESIGRLQRNVSRFVTPLGVGAHLAAWGVPEENITELDWWEESQQGSLRITATPARHFSGRSLTDANATLWASYALQGGRHRVFFSGDTGMHEQFAEISERLGPFDLAMLEVGQYNVHWMDVHLLPEQAIQAHQILGAGLLVPVHWGTFELAFHDWDETPRRLTALARRNHVRLFVPRLGESFEPGRALSQMPWWEEVGHSD